ncbi:hypothetical protein ACFCX0_45825 [Streptomyces sp. NPDC056352]
MEILGHSQIGNRGLGESFGEVTFPCAARAGDHQVLGAAGDLLGYQQR